MTRGKKEKEIVKGGIYEGKGVYMLFLHRRSRVHGPGEVRKTCFPGSAKRR